MASGKFFYGGCLVREIHHQRKNNTLAALPPSTEPDARVLCLARVSDANLLVGGGSYYRATVSRTWPRICSLGTQLEIMLGYCSTCNPLMLAVVVQPPAAILRPAALKLRSIPWRRSGRIIAQEEAEEEDPNDEDFMEELDASFNEVRRVAAGRRPRSRARAGFRNRAQPRTRREAGNDEDDEAERTPLRLGRQVIVELEGSYDNFIDRPSQQLLLGTLSLLFGFFVAQGQALGGGDQGLRWEYLSAGAATLVVERIGKGYWKRSPEERSPTLKLLNAFKVGFVWGCVLDALKFAG